jgi:hypothetical protein
MKSFFKVELPSGLRSIAPRPTSFEGMKLLTLSKIKTSFGDEELGLPSFVHSSKSCF